MSILTEIIAKKRERLISKKKSVPLKDLIEKSKDMPPVRDFYTAIKRKTPAGLVKIIAEIKRASPSEGLIRSDFDVREIASIYAAGGASAISVLTEEDYFSGDLKYIVETRDEVDVPVLRKDFIFDQYQMYESRAGSADAVLLIAAALSKAQAGELLSLASELTLHVLFEVHNLKELDMAMYLNAPIIGINNRNLTTMKVDLSTSLDMIKDITPENKIVVSESGIKTSEDVRALDDAGADAILVGTSLMKSADIAQKLGELLNYRNPAQE
ncbi:indole-3-glycerol phosphate synthase TrpC [Candidatus Magnetomonas plexicatena]|uniref:indole-3-glycerol phosphate synthase TrpC n=1 Tax=Candidatus Magnetomonas plexicatena TaxID=2552947 RepID=UPI001104F648|nr:indole-3-glycerol phosphate synthase TrpC [Nitrospirales bacterium LBB_01]